MRLIESLATTEPLAALFEDASVLAAMLRFEAALARAEAAAGIIPASAAEAIARCADVDGFDGAVLAREAQRAGTVAIPLIKELTERVRSVDADAARYVHWGATSQDVVDTALVLLLARAHALLETDHRRLVQGLAALSEEHRDTVLLGRTLLQAAPPVTLGLKAAGWAAAANRGWRRVTAAYDEALVVQFGGAVGTAAALGEQGIDVGEALAAELGLGYPDAPWHTHRDRLAALLAALGVYTMSLGKIARDVALLMQGEVAEAAEPPSPGRGGSSTMPHKRNPTGCALALAAANRIPTLVASFLSGMVQEHERAVGGWQAEWPTVVQVVQASGLAIASVAEIAEGLVVDAERMRANLDATLGVVFAERAMIELGQALGRDVAHRLLEDATRRALRERRRLAEVLADIPEVSGALPPEALRALDEPEGYLGSAEALRRRLLNSVFLSDEPRG
jgi:3-carboxy-cis,cis-muconate cycloisomerase